MVKQVELWVAPDAHPRELRAALKAVLKLPETLELKLERVGGSGPAPAVFSAGLLLADAASLVLDTGAPPPPSWVTLHKPQLAGCASIAAWTVLPPPYSALALLTLAAAAAVIAPPAGKGLLANTASTASLLITAHAFDALHPAAMPAPMATLGFYGALFSALYRMRVLLINILIMLGQLALVRTIAWETRVRKAAAGGATAAARR